MLLDNLTEINSRIAAAASRVNRSPESIKLVAVSKLVPAEKIIEAFNLGQHLFGENYVQEALEKIPLIRKQSQGEAQFHFIGKLQSNKAKKAVEFFDVIETVDSIKLGLALDRHGETLGKPMEALVQVNLGEEARKSGVQLEHCEQILRGLIDCKFLRIVGLMTMPPNMANPEDVRPYFKKLRQLAEEMAAKNLLGQQKPIELSMGMSGDFEVAIEEGATIIRVGTAIFGNRSH
jgi:PLP dependent protein